MTEIEHDLRAWMQERAARVHASPEILKTDYRPRTRARSWRPRAAIGGGVAVLAGTVTAVLSLAGGASNAFAGWSARPTTASPLQLQAAQAYCRANIPDPTTTQQAVDNRGPFTIIAYSGPAGVTQTYNFCTYGPGMDNASGWTSSPPVSPAAGRLFLWTDHTGTDNGQDYGVMFASAGAGVSGALLTLTDGSQVTATVQNGWVIAWWPGDGHVASAQLTTASGTTTQSFNYPCDVHSCSGGPHGGAPGGGPGGG